MLDSLPALGLIEKRDGKYFLTPTADVFLVKGKPSYVGDFRHVALALWDGMAHLKESLKTGKPLSRMDTGAELQVWEKLVLGIIVIAEPAAKALCDLLKIGSERKGIKVLDIAGGSSIFGMTILSRDPSAQVTQLDWPNVNAVAKKSQPRARSRRQDSLHRRRASQRGDRNAIITIWFSPVIFAASNRRKGNQELFAKAYLGAETRRHFRRQRFRAQRRAHRTDLCLALFRLHVDAHAGRRVLDAVAVFRLAEEGRIQRRSKPTAIFRRRCRERR